jgi:hypothetical protein
MYLLLVHEYLCRNREIYAKTSICFYKYRKITSYRYKSTEGGNMKITIDHHDHQVSVENSRDDVDIDEMRLLLKALLLLATWTEEQVQEMIIEEML